MTVIHFFFLKQWVLVAASTFMKRSFKGNRGELLKIYPFFEFLCPRFYANN